MKNLKKTFGINQLSKQNSLIPGSALPFVINAIFFYCNESCIYMYLLMSNFQIKRLFFQKSFVSSTLGRDSFLFVGNWNTGIGE